MKLIISGDWQLDAAPAHDRINPDTNRSTRFAETVETIEGLIDAGLAAGAEGLVHLGDLTENKNPRSIELEAAANLFTRAMKDGRRVWAVAGNHDGSVFSISASSFSPLAKMRTDSFKLFHKVELDEEIGMLAVPYAHKALPGDVRNMVQAALSGSDAGLPGKKKLFAAIHYGVVGTSGPCAVGPRNLVLANSDYLDAEDLSCDRLSEVFAGHIHKAQVLDMTTKCKAYFPGSPVICDMGERNDPKTWILFDTVTREVKINPIPQRRRWIEVPYYPEIAEGGWDKDSTDAPWTAEDIVKIKGTYTKPDYPKNTIEEAFKKGLVRPFSLDFEVAQAKKDKTARIDISVSGGLRETLQNYVRENFHRHSENPNIIAPATALALDVLREQGAETYDPIVDAESMEIKNFLTIKTYSGTFRQGVPTLIVGKNGIGKTNWMDATLWCFVGQTSKGISQAGVVRQNTTEASVTLYLRGHGGNEIENKYRIIRTVKLNKAGKPTQSLRLEKMGLVEWELIGDGGIAETQAQINALIGGGYISLRATAFKFQNDTNPIIRAKPEDRKAVIGEVLGLEPLAKAFKILDAKRLESQGAHKAGQQRLEGMVLAGEGQEARLEKLKASVAEVTVQITANKEALPKSEKLEAEAAALATKETAQVTAVRAQIDALPNTAAILSGAEQSLATYKSGYETRHKAKQDRYVELKAKVTEAEKELASLKAPDPAEIASLETQEKAQTAVLKLATTSHLTVMTENAGKSAEYEAALKRHTDADMAKKAAESSLGTLPPPDDSDFEADLKKAETAQAEADGLVQKLALESVSHETAKSAAEAEIQKLRDEKNGYNGQDIGTCSKCGQRIDSKHIEMEMARIERAISSNMAIVDEKSVTIAGVKKALGEASLAKVAAQTLIRDLSEKKQAQALDKQKRKSLAEQVVVLEKALAQAGTDLDVKAKAKTDAEALVPSLQKAVEDAKAVLETTTSKLRVLREVGTKLGSLTGKLEAERRNLAETLAEGTREAEEYKVQLEKLTAAHAKAAAEHAINDATAGALRKNLEVLEVASQAAQAKLTEAKTLVSTTRASLESLETRLADFNDQIKEIETQRASLEKAKFELGMLLERANIDAAAASLLDPKQGLPIFLVDSSLPFLEERINLYMEQLGMDRLTVELSTLDGDKESLLVLVDNGRPGPRLDIAAFSGGQLDRVEYAIKCALADLQRQTRGVTLGLVAYDEPTGGLDEAGKEGLIRLLYERCNTYPVSLVVSHDVTLIQSFDHRLQFSQGTEEETVISEQ